MADPMFDSAADRISFSEAVDYLEQDRVQLVSKDLVELYVRKGLWTDDGGGRFTLTEEGRRQHEIARRERFNDG